MGTWAQTSTSAFMPFFVNFMEKEPGIKFCGVLIRFPGVIKLQSLGFSVRDVIPADVQNILTLVLFGLFC